MQPVAPITLARAPVRLEPLSPSHEDDLREAASDGQLWRLHVTSVPAPEEMAASIAQALEMQRAGTRLPFAVLDEDGVVIGSTSYHDIVPAVERLEIGYTWYARRCQGTRVNPACKLLLMQHAFETLGAQLVGLRTDALNLHSRRAIEKLGARCDGTLRHHALRRDGTVRDTVMYSITAAEWPGVRAALAARLGD